MAAVHHMSPGTDRPIDRLLSPLASFLRIEAAGGLLLLGFTAIALIWANSPWRDAYHHLWHETILTIGIGETLSISHSLGHWVNDGLMAVFFFVVGLEIKREMLAGELSSPRQAMVPISAAIGGMLVPAVIYSILNAGGEGAAGWAIPCATDIAFALGVIALLGDRVPLSIKIFVTAAAIVDDIGAVVIIAFFYTSDLSFTALGIAAVVLAVLVAMNLLHVRKTWVYALLGIVLWVAFLKSGVHATIAGVLLAFTIPARFRIKGADFVRFSRRAIDEIVAAGGEQNDIMTNKDRQVWLHGLEQACEHVQPPMLRLEHMIHPWSSYLIMPIFALANAGVDLSGDLVGMLTSRVSLGILLGLVLGKQIGVTLFAWGAIRSGLGDAPRGVGLRQIYAASWLTGIGFTMSLFIANLGLGEGVVLETAKIGVLAGSLISGVVGYILLRGRPT